jgi:hypothetical protein
MGTATHRKEFATELKNFLQKMGKLRVKSVDKTGQMCYTELNSCDRNDFNTERRICHVFDNATHQYHQPMRGALPYRAAEGF